MRKWNPPRAATVSTEETRRIAGHVQRELKELSLALQGASEKMRKEACPPDGLLMQRAFRAIVHASCEGLINALFDPKELLPESSVLIDEHVAMLQHRAGRDNVNATASLPDGNRKEEGRGRGTAGDEPQLNRWEDVRWRSKLSQIKIEDMLAAIQRDGDPAADSFENRVRIGSHLLVVVWRYLANHLPGLMSPDVAYIKNEILPGVDPWLGNWRDFRKTAWVLAVTADHIDQVWVRCDAPAKLIGFFRVEDIRDQYPQLTDVQFERVRKNLENRRKKDEDRAIAMDTAGGRPRYLYPLADVVEFVERELGTRRDQ